MKQKALIDKDTLAKLNTAEAAIEQAVITMNDLFSITG